MKLFLFVITIVTVNCLKDVQIWNNFKVTFEKSYINKNEEVDRFKIFQDNLRQIEEHNARYNMGKETYKMGLNQFADLTRDEFVQMLGLSKRVRPSRTYNVTLTSFSRKVLADVPESVDWREKGAVTPVKNQGGCGSCWAFSAIGGLEGQYAIKYNKLISLSEQNLVDCAGPYGNGDCNAGGIMSRGFDYVKDNGINTEEDYPYDGDTMSCRYQPSKNVLHLSGYQQIQPSEDALKYAVAIYGPISVSIDAGPAQLYESGILNDPNCKNRPDELNHGVLVVGYGVEDGTDYWIIKNSWGPYNGEKGYIRLIRNANNQCGIVDDASRPLVI
ncbi:cathepsin L-like proteinase [Diabrotica undecimpunctata]|uniref:cathepsin L-like proteinase n=1 Tax=Diabrotica undecimpunctata TaxID=50387 RepID=UPI003B6346E4